MATEDKYQHIISWIKESIEARSAQNAYVERAIMAYQGKPSHNSYQRRLEKAARLIKVDDEVRANAITSATSDLKGKRNYTVHNAVETIVSMSQGGVGEYRFGPYDDSLKKSSDVLAKLSSAAKHFYDTERMDSLVPQYIRDAPLRGEAHLYIKGRSGSKDVTLLDSNQMLLDPRRFKRNKARFIGFSQRESLREVKDSITKTGSGYKLKTLNHAKVYLDEIVNMLNDGKYQPQVFDHAELRDDINIFYTPIKTDIQARQKDEPDYKYAGDEVECSYIYDLQQERVYRVANRRFVISDKPSDLKRDIKCEVPTKDGKTKTITKTVKLDHPFVPLPFLDTSWDSYAISPLFYLLDDFDDLCAMESLLDHTLSIMSPLTFIGQSSDVERVSQIASVSGEMVEGVPATFGVLSKTHDLTPLVEAIKRTEDKIKRTMKATDIFEMQAMLGDRASAKEVSSASGQVAQGINPFMANIETAMAELGTKFIKLELIFGEDVYKFSHNGAYAELTAEDLAGDFEVYAKLQTSIKLEQMQNARSAIELLGALGSNEAVNKKEFFSTLIPIAMNSLVSREQAEKMVAPQYRPMPEETINRIKQNAEENAKKTNIEKMNLGSMSESDLDEAILQLAGNIPAGSEDMIASANGTPAVPPQAPAAGPMPSVAAGASPQVAGPLPPRIPGPAPVTTVPQNPESGGENAPVNRSELYG